MAIHFRCLNCYAVLSIASQKAGGHAACPKCRHRQTVPMRTDPAIAGKNLAAESEADEPAVLAPADQELLPAAVPSLRERIDSSANVPARSWEFLTGIAMVTFSATILLALAIGAMFWLIERNTISTGKPDAIAQGNQQSSKKVAAASLQEDNRAIRISPALAPESAPRQSINNELKPISNGEANQKKNQSAPAALPQPQHAARPPAKKVARPKADNRAFQKQHLPGTAHVASKLGENSHKAGRAKTWTKGHRSAAKPLPPRGYSATELQKTLLAVKQIGVNIDEGTRKGITYWAKDPENLKIREPAVPFDQLSVLQGLPLLKGSDCTMTADQSSRFAAAVEKVRTVLAKALVKGKIDEKKLKEPKSWESPQEADVRAMIQMLPADGEPARRYLIALLERAKGVKAGEALARRAVMDPSPTVRKLACIALKKRRVQEYQNALVRYLNYPLPAAAEHASKILLDHKIKTAVPALIGLLKEPDVTLPRTVTASNIVPITEPDDVRHRLVVTDPYKQRVMPQLVRINHLKNCLLCHAPHPGPVGRRTSMRFAVGAVPRENQTLPPSLSRVYYARGDLFVRADITYLRQDFSMVQPAEEPGKWPKMQRFDFLVRMVPVSDKEASRLHWRYLEQGPSRQRQLLLYTLRHLTGQNRGSTYQDWALLLKN